MQSILENYNGKNNESMDTSKRTVESDMLLIGRIVRATRKQLGISQIVFARELGLHQAALSRIENGEQNLTAPQWLELCRYTKISMESIRLGYIECNTSIELESGTRVGSFRIPSRYAQDRGTKVRSMIPIINYYSDLLTPARLDEFLSSKEIDPDFFLNLENQLNISFVYDLISELKEKNLFKQEALEPYLNGLQDIESHGIFHYEYDIQKSSYDLMRSFFRNFTHYDCNSTFEFGPSRENDRAIEFSAKPKAHLREISKKYATLGDFQCAYRKQFLVGFSAYGGRRRKSLTETSCFHKGGEKCVYQIDVAD